MIKLLLKNNGTFMNIFPSIYLLLDFYALIMKTCGGYCHDI